MSLPLIWWSVKLPNSIGSLILANSKNDARCRIKKELKIPPKKRLPLKTLIERLP